MRVNRVLARAFSVGFAGALIGGIAGAAGPQGVAAAAGVSAGVATVAHIGPHFKEAVEDGMTGEPLNDLALTCAATFSGGVVLTSFSAAAGIAGYVLAQSSPVAGRVVGALAGAAAGASVGIWN